MTPGREKAIALSLPQFAAASAYAAARLAGIEPGPGAERWREVWQAVGVLKNDLSASALVLGLTAAGSSLTDRVLRLHAAAGGPCRLTTGQLLRHPPDFGTERPVVHLCENPAVLSAAARRFGKAAAPHPPGIPSSRKRCVVAVWWSTKNKSSTPCWMTWTRVRRNDLSSAFGVRKRQGFLCESLCVETASREVTA